MQSEPEKPYPDIRNPATRKAFEAHISALVEKLEARQSSYSGLLVVTIPLALALVTAVVLYHSFLLLLLDVGLETVGGDGRDSPERMHVAIACALWLVLSVTTVMMWRAGVNIFLLMVPLWALASFYILVFQLLPWLTSIISIPISVKMAVGSVLLIALAVGVGLYIGLRPIFKYRRHRMVLGDFEVPVSIKAGTFSRIFGFFGDFIYQREGGISAYDFKPSGIIPDYDEYISEDWLTGVYHDVKIEIGECTLVNKTRKEALFHGLMVLLDITETQIRLGRPFDGHTIVIGKQEEGGQKTPDTHSMVSVPLPSPALQLDGKLEAFSTHPEEAQEVLQETLLNELIGLQRTLQDCTIEANHWDDRILRFFEQLHVKKNYPMAEGYEGINETIQCAFYGDKVLITIPYSHDLFEPNSIFEKPLHREDIDISWALMQVVQVAVDSVRQYR